jgi:hypothetical protein
MTVNMLCDAIQNLHLVRFYYKGDTVPGYRVVEPHQVAYNRANNLALSGWFLAGVSGSGDGQGWREYLISDISLLSVLPDRFAGPRPGYRRGGGKMFHNVQCEL